MHLSPFHRWGEETQSPGKSQGQILGPQPLCPRISSSISSFFSNAEQEGPVLFSWSQTESPDIKSPLAWPDQPLLFSHLCSARSEGTVLLGDFPVQKCTYNGCASDLWLQVATCIQLRWQNEKRGLNNGTEGLHVAKYGYLYTYMYFTCTNLPSLTQVLYYAATCFLLHFFY